MEDLYSARLHLCEAIQPIARTRWVSLDAANQCHAASDIRAAINAPPEDNSAMDGYAIRTADLQSQTSFPISQTIAAGANPAPLEAGTAARIFTGASIPIGADCVVIQENCSRSGDMVTPLNTPKPGDNIRPQGQDIQRDGLILTRGQKLDPSHLALLAATGVTGFDAFERPKVALLNTGSELVEPGQPLQPGQIYNSNHIMLRQLLQQWGCDVIASMTLCDDLDTTRKRLHDISCQVDLIITSGGVSVGEHDHVKAAIESLGHMHFWKINIKPGKPLAFGQIGNTPIIALPGNPVSAFINALLFVRPAMASLCAAPYSPLCEHRGRANFTINKPRSRPELMRAKVHDGELSLYPNQSSGVIHSLTWANALVFINSNTQVNQGDSVPYYPLSELMY